MECHVSLNPLTVLVSTYTQYHYSLIYQPHLPATTGSMLLGSIETSIADFPLVRAQRSRHSSNKAVAVIMIVDLITLQATMSRGMQATN